jgi:hypothetical protein
VHKTGLKRTATRALHAVADADAEIASLGARPALALREADIIDRVECRLLALEKVSAVERHRRARPRLQWRYIGHLVRLYQIAPPDFCAVELQFARDAIQNALHRKCPFWIARAADRRGRDLVRFDH